MTLSQRAEFNALRERYINDLKPEGPDQEIVVEHIAHVAWTIRVLERNEAALYASHPAVLKDKNTRNVIQGLSVLRNRYSHVYQAAMRLFLLTANRDAGRRKSRVSGGQENDGA